MRIEVTDGDWVLFYNYGIALERLQRLDEAEVALRRALDLSPDQAYVLNYLAYIWIEQGENLGLAKDMLHKAVKLQPDDGFIVDS